MATRGSDPRHHVLPTLPSPENLSINGSRLPTYLQVLLCFLANVEDQRRNDTTKNQKLTRICANNAVGEVLKHYNKARIIHISEHKMAEKVEDLHNAYKGLMKLNPERRIDSPITKQFQEKLLTRCHFGPGIYLQEWRTQRRVKLVEKRKPLVKIYIS